MVTMANQLINNEQFATMNSRLSEAIVKLQTLAQMSGQANEAAQKTQLLSELEALTSAPMSKALDKADIWKRRMREAIVSYRTPAKTIEDVNKEFSRENTEYKNLHGWSYSCDRMLQKGRFGVHQFHPLTGAADTEPILYPYNPDVKVFYEKQCIEKISDSKILNLPHTMLAVLEVAQLMGLGWEQNREIFLQILQYEAPAIHEDVKDIKASADLMEALIALFDFRLERNRVLRMMKMCHRKKGTSVRAPVTRYRNLVKELIALEGVEMPMEELQEKADREAKKVLFQFLEKNTAAELKEYLLKKSRSETAIGQPDRVNLNDAFKAAEDLERIRGYQLVTDKHLMSVDHEVALFYTNLNDVDLERDEVEAVCKELDMASDAALECLFTTRMTGISPGFDPSKPTVANRVPEEILNDKDKQIVVEKPPVVKRARSRDPSRNRKAFKQRDGTAKTSDNTKTKRAENSSDWKDSATEPDLCVICGESYAAQKDAGGNVCKEDYCSVYHRPLKHKDVRFCILCARSRQVKAYHPRMWCKTLLEQTAQKIFMLTLNAESDDEAEEEETTGPTGSSLNN